MKNSIQNMAVLEHLLEKRAGFLPPFSPAPPFAPPLLGLAAPLPSELQHTQKKEIALWQQWNERGRQKDDLKPLLDSFKPVINKEVRKYSSAEVPKSAVRAEVNKQFINAVKTYDPSKAQLNSWVITNLRKARRFVTTYQNLGKIPEGQISLITPYDRAKQELLDEMGHEPDTQTIAGRMGVPVRRVAQLERERRGDYALGNFAGEDPAEILDPKELEAFQLVQYELTPEERTVYEYTFGLNGRPALRPGDISKQTKIHPSKLSRIRNKLRDKVYEAMAVLED